jgi:hypothetical protein
MDVMWSGAGPRRAEIGDSDVKGAASEKAEALSPRMTMLTTKRRRTLRLHIIIGRSME